MPRSASSVALETGPTLLPSLSKVASLNMPRKLPTRRERASMTACFTWGSCDCDAADLASPAADSCASTLFACSITGASPPCFTSGDCPAPSPGFVVFMISLQLVADCGGPARPGAPLRERTPGRRPWVMSIAADPAVRPSASARESSGGTSRSGASAPTSRRGRTCAPASGRSPSAVQGWSASGSPGRGS